MDINKMFPSRFLKGAELTGPVQVTISRIVTEQTYKPGVGQADIFVMYCERATRGVVLSKPLAFSIAEALHEKDTDRWPGRTIVLYPQSMKVGGRDLIAIRARPATNGQLQEAQS